MSDAQILAELKEFIVHNNNLELLEAKLREFNPLRVLAVENYEIRHSNILAWILNPQESHGFGDKALKKLISETIIANEHIEAPISLMEVQNGSFYDAQVLREWSNIDILVISKSNKFILLIENKLGKRGFAEQIKRYVEKIKETHPGFKILPIMLTLTGEIDDEEAEYAFLSHETIYRVVKSMVELYRNDLNPKIYDFVNYYLKTLGVLTMQTNNEIVQLCKEIYKEHKEAIDTIIAYGATTSFNEAIDSFKKGKNLIESQRRHSDFWFVPSSFQGKVPETAVNWASPFVISYWFRFMKEENKLRLILEVGPFKDPEQRVKLLKFLKKEFQSFRVPDRSLQLERLYTRINSVTVHFDEWDNVDKIANKMDDLYKNKFKDINETIIKAISKFQW